MHTDIKPIRRIAVVGSGVIGASWSALFLAKGLNVTANDIALPTASSKRPPQAVIAGWMGQNSALLTTP